jgi:Tetratricopeptide Repeats-Sensor
MSKKRANTTERTRWRCFVVMGFGKKTDLATGRTLDLDKSYRNLIKPVVEEKGIECIRADEILHSGPIDVPMYEQLFRSDVVIADLSTANPNAFYELGMRHALRPYTTIVISEDKLTPPFNVNHLKITNYKHLGEDIGYDEVIRFRRVLGETLDSVLKDRSPDSPLYTHLQGLQPPSLREQVEEAMRQVGKAATRMQNASHTAGIGPDASTLAVLISKGEQAIKNSDFDSAKRLFARALRLVHPDQEASRTLSENTCYLRQRLVLATYKPAEKYDVAKNFETLNEAKRLLEPLCPEESNDPETLALAGAIETRLFEATKCNQCLTDAINYRRRAYHLREDLFSGVCFALLLNHRANTSLNFNNTERVGDLVWANRVRRELLDRSQRRLIEIRKRKDQARGHPDQYAKDQLIHDTAQEFWCIVARAAAHYGLGEFQSYRAAKAEASKLEQPMWMMRTLEKHIEQTRKILDKYGHLLDPPWHCNAVEAHSCFLSDDAVVETEVCV